MDMTPQESLAQDLAAATGCSLPDARRLVVIGYAAALEVIGGDRHDSKALLQTFGLRPRWRRGDLT